MGKWQGCKKALSMVKLNLGSKQRKLKGFDNLDKIFGWLFQDGLPQYADGTVEGITISHALMFLTVPEIETFMKEARRVLCIGGMIRITEDDTENPASDTYKTGCMESKPNSLTGPKMMRKILEQVGFKVFDVDEATTHFHDESLIQAYRGGVPRRYFIEGVKEEIIEPQKKSALHEGIKMQGKPAEIPDCSRDDLPHFFKELGFKVGAEIGVYKADFTSKFAEADLKMFGVDPWTAHEDYENDPVHAQFQDRQDFLFGHAKRRVAPYENVSLIRKTSMDAVKDFKNESLDFVYIDGHHGFKYATEDIWEWTKKVRKGGIISGHDYGTNQKAPNDPYVLHVQYVVDAYTAALGIKNWYVLGRKEKVEGEKRDTWRSWMWFKE